MIYEARGYSTNLYKFDKIEPFEYITRFKPLVMPDGEDIEHYKRFNAPYCISGRVREVKGQYKRSNDTLIARDLIFIDYDEIEETPQAFKNRVHKCLNAISYVLYPTIKHTEEKPRYRLVVKPEREMNKAEYINTIKEITELIGIDYDVASLTWSQLQGLPVVRADPQSYDKIVNFGRSYPIAKADNNQSDNIASNQFKKQEGEFITPQATRKTITVRVIETLLNGFGEQGERNVNATKFIGLLLCKYVDYDVYRAYELTEIANNNSSYPLPKDELKRTFESIVKAEIRKRTYSNH